MKTSVLLPAALLLFAAEAHAGCATMPHRSAY